MDVAVGITAFVLGCIFTATVGWIIGRVAPGWWDKLTRQPPVHVHIETDPSIFYSGYPNWLGAAFVTDRPLAEIGPPPTSLCRHWRAWLRPLGVFDGHGTHICVTITGNRDSEVLVQGIRVANKSREPLRGTTLTCPVGGASIVVRHARVLLDDDAAITTYIEEGGSARQGPFLLSVGRGEVEVFHIVAVAEQCRCEWTAQLFLVADGKREVIDIDDDGNAFRTSGTTGLPEYYGSQGSWTPA